MVELNPKQQAFADYYIETGNAEESAKRAGYSARGNTTKLLQNTTIKRYIEERMGEIKNERIADQQEVLEFLTAIVRGEKTQEVLRGVGKGAQTIDEMEVGASDRIKAAELIGKRYALWTDKQQIEGIVPVTIVNDLDD